MNRFKVGYHTGDAQALRARYVSAYGPEQEVKLWAMFESSVPLVIESLVHTALRPWHCGGELFLEECLPTLVVTAALLCQSSVPKHMAPLFRVCERHSWSSEPTLRLPSTEVSLITHWLVHGKDISPAEFSSIVARSSEASDEEKWHSYRFEYMRAWGLKAVDEEFVDQNGTQCGSGKVTRLVKLLDTPAHLPAPCRYGTQVADTMRTRAVAEVIQALGFSGPFDLCHRLGDLSSGAARQRVLSTRCFQGWSDMRKLFSSHAKKKSEHWYAEEILEVVRLILDNIGLKLVTKRTRPRSRGAPARRRHTRKQAGRLNEDRICQYEYTLQADAVIRMKELLALQRKDIEGAGQWSHLL